MQATTKPDPSDASAPKGAPQFTRYQSFIAGLMAFLQFAVILDLSLIHI